MWGGRTQGELGTTQGSTAEARRGQLTTLPLPSSGSPLFQEASCPSVSGDIWAPLFGSLRRFLGPLSLCPHTPDP